MEDLRRDKARLEDENGDLNRDFEAIDLLASKGFQARKKQGRPQKGRQLEEAAMKEKVS